MDQKETTNKPQGRKVHLLYITSYTILVYQLYNNISPRLARRIRIYDRCGWLKINQA